MFSKPSVILAILLLIFSSNILFAQESGFKKLDEPIPNGFKADDIYPNPYGFVTNTKFYCPDSSFVKIDVLNKYDQSVRKIYQGLIAPGIYFVEWDLETDEGTRTIGGIYRFRIEALSNLKGVKTQFIAEVYLPIIPD